MTASERSQYIARFVPEFMRLTGVHEVEAQRIAELCWNASGAQDPIEDADSQADQWGSNV
jgi:hypothetical protein